eukprot:jgi/Mesvir1/28913/Mv25723-RA.1
MRLALTLTPPARLEGKAKPQNLSEEQLQKNDPEQLFRLFWTQRDVLERIVQQTNLYAALKEAGKGGSRDWKDLTLNELGKFIGIIFTMSLLKLPSRADYFSSEPIGGAEPPMLQRHMSKYRFDQITRFLHLAPTSERPTDKQTREHRLWQCDWLERHLNETYKKYVKPGQRASLDERSIPTRHRLSPITVFNPNKPEEFHIKQFGDNDWPTGYLYHVETYDKLPQANHTFEVVKRMVAKWPHKTKWAMDRWYTSRAAVEECAAMGHQVVGTIMTNRKDLPFEEVRALMPKGKAAKQGDYAWAVNKEGLVLTCWMDKKQVWTLSKGLGLTEVQVSRHGGRTSERVTVPAPSSITDYWDCMHATDKNDQLCAEYDIQKAFVTKIWWHRLFTGHMAHTATNAYLLHVMIAEQEGQVALTHAGFLKLLAHELIHNKWGAGTRVRINELAAVLPVGAGKAGRRSGLHKVEYIPFTNQAQCAVCTAAGNRKRTVFWCRECDIALCNKGEYDCFRVWHEEEVEGLDTGHIGQRATLGLTQRGRLGKEWAARDGVVTRAEAGPSTPAVGRPRRTYIKKKGQARATP